MTQATSNPFGSESKVHFIMLVANNPVVISEKVDAIKKECNKKVTQLQGYGYAIESTDSSDGYAQRCWLSKEDKKAKNGKKWVVVGYKTIPVV